MSGSRLLGGLPPQVLIASDGTWKAAFRTDQIGRQPRLAEHLKQHLGRFPEQLDPVTEIGGMALDLAADLQPITQQHRPQLCDQLLTGIARLPEGTAQIPLEPGFMAGGVDLLMGPGGAERRR